VLSADKPQSAPWT